MSFFQRDQRTRPVGAVYRKKNLFPVAATTFREKRCCSSCFGFLSACWPPHSFWLTFNLVSVLLLLLSKPVLPLFTQLENLEPGRESWCRFECDRSRGTIFVALWVLFCRWTSRRQTTSSRVQISPIAIYQYPGGSALVQVLSRQFLSLIVPLSSTFSSHFEIQGCAPYDYLKYWIVAAPTPSTKQSKYSRLSSQSKSQCESNPPSNNISAKCKFSTKYL